MEWSWCETNGTNIFQIHTNHVYGQHEAIYMAYELGNISPRDHQFSFGKTRCIPPFSEKMDVVLGRAENLTKSKQAFAYCSYKERNFTKVSWRWSCIRAIEEKGDC